MLAGVEQALHEGGRTRLVELCIEADAESLASGNLTYFVEWLAHSGAVSSAERILFHDMTIINQQLCIAVGLVLSKCASTLTYVGLGWSPSMDAEIGNCKCVVCFVSSCADFDICSQCSILSNIVHK